MTEPIRVLHIVSALERGGAETLIMNIYRHIDRKKVQFDFITHNDRPGDFDQEIEKMGGVIYKIPSLGSSGPIRYLKALINIMSANNYAAIHAHTDFQSGFPALAAKICKIRYRICHSHSNNWLQNGLKGRLILKLLKLLIKISATKLCSCSEEAATFLFGKASQVHILKNGINISEFLTAEQSNKEQILNELSVPAEAKIIGHIGRFSESKNHQFLLKVVKQMVEKDPSYIAFLVGDGPLRNTIEQEAEQFGLQNHVRFLGVRSDIPKLMKAFDLFLFPSKFEGFGIVLLEAQCSGIPCIVADTVPKSTDMGLGLVTFLSLEENIDEWCNSIGNVSRMEKPNRSLILNNISKYGFNIQDNVHDWVNLYGLKSVG